MAKFKDKFRGVLIGELDPSHIVGDRYNRQNTITRELETTKN